MSVPPLRAEVWSAAIRPAGELDLAPLSAAERKRVERLVSPPAAARSATSRLLLRRVLENHPSVRADFDLSWEHGPRLAGGPFLSMSHSGERVVVALCAEAPVGIDLEPLIRAAGLTRALIERITSPAEQAALARLHSGDEWGRAALELWTAKEAILKATGEGLTAEPARVSVERAADGLRLESHDGIPGLVAGCALARLAVDPSYLCTLAALSARPLRASVRDGDELLG